MDNKSDKKADYQFIKKILIDVQDLDKGEQINYIEKVCRSRTDLIPSLLKMLNHGESEIAQSMDKPIILEHIPELDTRPSSQEPPLLIGTVINQYEIVEHIGSGGMGNVYAAQQSYPAERIVALKLLKKTPNQQLLMTETQILARLNHPNIATLFEIDKTEEGQFFIAMELIKGDDMVSWSKSRNYSQLQIIKLFQQLCSGISYAHEKNIIHCDIKPSNVLVTDIDGSATVKIIDFGISQFEEQTESYHEISGTPAYLAPEVLSTKGELTTDARRDVYALGILLKKLLPQTLPIDIEAIIDKATAHDKNQRYQSSAELSSDLERYVKKRTVTARKSNLWYVSKLLIQRRFEVFLIIAGVLILSLASAYFAQRNQAQVATEQALVAKAAQKEAEELTGFLTELFNVANPERSNSQIVTAVDLLDKAKDKLIAIENPSLSDARFMQTIGSIYTRMDKLKQAKAMIEQSLKIKNQSLDSDNNEITVSLIQLGLIHKNLKEFDQSEQTLLKALDLLNSQNDASDSKIAYVHNHLGNLYMRIEKVDKSISHHQLAISLREKEEDNKLLADSYNNLGVIYRQTKKWDKASIYLNLALEQYLKQYDSTHPYIGAAKSNISYIEEQRFNWDESEKLMQEVWENWKLSYGKDHKNTITSQRNLARYYDRRMQFPKAINIYDGLIKQFESNGNHEQQANYTRLKALSFAHNDQNTQAISLLKHSLNLLDLVNDKKEKYLHERILNQYAVALISLGDYPEAQKLLSQSLSELEASYQPENINRLFTLNLIADMYYQKEDFNKSIENFNEVIKYHKQSQVSNLTIQITAHIGLGKVYHAQNYFQNAESSLNKALILNQNIFGEIHKVNAIVYYELAQLSISQENLTQAKQWLAQALEIQKLVLPEQHKDLLTTIDLLKTL